jgi:hypothetical protein
MSVASALPDVRSWSAAKDEIARLLATKKVKLAPGARGLRARLRVLAERKGPSGDATQVSAGALPDDVPGADPVCVKGFALGRKCLDGMPVGATGRLADLSNVGAKPTRAIHVQVLSAIGL